MDDGFAEIRPTLDAAGECEAPKITLERRLKVEKGSGCCDTFLGRGTAAGAGIAPAPSLVMGTGNGGFGVSAWNS